jgi:uncharacterized UPF0146 family protein
VVLVYSIRVNRDLAGQVDDVAAMVGKRRWNPSFITTLTTSFGASKRPTSIVL